VYSQASGMPQSGGKYGLIIPPASAAGRGSLAADASGNHTSGSVPEFCGVHARPACIIFTVTDTLASDGLRPLGGGAAVRWPAYVPAVRAVGWEVFQSIVACIQLPHGPGLHRINGVFGPDLYAPDRMPQLTHRWRAWVAESRRRISACLV